MSSARQAVLQVQWRLPVPVGQCHHDVERRQEQHEVEEGVGVGDAVPLIVHHSVGSAPFLPLRLHSILNERRLVAAQGQFVHLRVCGVTDANGRRGGGGRGRDRSELAVCVSNVTKGKKERKEHSPGIKDTHEEEDQSHNPLRIPPLHHMLLTSRGRAVQPDHFQETRVTLPVFGTEELCSFTLQ